MKTIRSFFMVVDHIISFIPCLKKIVKNISCIQKYYRTFGNIWLKLGSNDPAYSIAILYSVAHMKTSHQFSLQNYSMVSIWPVEHEKALK